MPKRFRKKGISRMQSVSDICARNQDVGMLHSESAGIFGNTAETADVGIGKSVGNLQGNAQQHGENEENSHFLLLE